MVSVPGTEMNLFDLVSRAGAELRQHLGVEPITALDAASVQASLPSDPEAAQLYAEGLKRLRLFDALGARALLEKAAAVEPDYPLSHSALAEAWRWRGSSAKAREEAKKALDLSAKLPRQDRLLVEAHYRETTREWDKAAEAYRALFDLFPDSVNYGCELARVLTRAHKAKDALVPLQALRKLPPPNGDDPSIDIVEASAYDSLGNVKAQDELLAKAAEKSAARGQPFLLAAALQDQCVVFQERGLLGQALAACQRARQTFARSGDRYGVASVLMNQGDAWYTQGNLEEARKAYEQALTVFREVGNDVNIAMALNNIGGVLHSQGNHRGAQALYQQALAAFREAGSKGGPQAMLHNIAEQLKIEGNLGEANRTYRQAMDVGLKTGDEDSQASDLDGLGSTLCLQGDLAQSRDLLGRSLEIGRRIDDKEIQGWALFHFGELARWQGDLEQARGEYQQALDIQKAMGAQIDAAQTQLAFAELSIEHGQAKDVEPAVRSSREAVRKQGDFEDEIWADTVLARALLAEGKLAEAQKQIDAASVLAAKNQNQELRFKFTLAAASVRAASGKSTDLAAAAGSLESALAQAISHGYVPYQYEARLALGEIEAESGHKSSARALLAALQKDAQAKGFDLIARKAGAIRN